jgi:MscS family membrane protein
MKNPWRSSRRLLVVLSLLLGSQGTPAQAQEKSGEKYRSPRATVRTLFTALTVSRANPQVIQEAAACLDLSGPAVDPTSGGLLATQLETILRAREIDTDLIADDVKGDVYVLPNDDGRRIGLARSPDGAWRFDRETVAKIPKLFAEAQKQLQDRNREAAALSVSPDFASARAMVRTLVTGFRRQDYSRILRCMDLSDVPNVARGEVGRQLANMLKQIIVRQPRIILQEIPDSNYSDPYVVLSLPEGTIEIVRIPSGERKGEWVFSRDTVNSIEKLFVAFEDKPYREEIVAMGETNHLPPLWSQPELWFRSHLPAWARASVLRLGRLNLEVYELAGYVVVPALAYGLYRLALWLLTVLLHRALTRRGWDLSRHAIAKRLRPAGRFLGVLFLRWGLLVLGPDRVLLVPLLMVLNPLLWLMGMWAVFSLLDLVTKILETSQASEGRKPDLSQMVWPVGSLVLKIALFVATLFQLMSMFSWDMAAVVTGLGIGGLAFALGAQDSLKNLFGSFTLIADRPFVVGESVKIGNHEVGVVEVVGLRSTRIRTTDDTLLIVPNSSLTTMEITNYGRRRFRRFHTRIGVAYSTSRESLAAFRNGIQDLIRRHPVTRKEHFEVAVIELAASSIEILVNLYFEVADRKAELAARDALILDILQLVQDLGVELAYPTQTVHLVAAAEPTPESAAPAR